MAVGSNKDVADASWIILHGKNIEESDKQYTVTDVEFEAILLSIKKYFFHQRMVYFVNKLELSDQKHQTNGNIRDENYKWNFLFAINYFILFGTYHH